MVEPLDSLPQRVGSRSLSERIAGFQKLPQNWKRTAASAERATGMAAKGGLSVESTYTNKVTDETILVHDACVPAGSLLPNHLTFNAHEKRGK